ncbi:hypothetical protein GDO81_013019 [Engystomops pustulosus]|uniref:Uncharacterized protein n=1 Tax=Engystomops pustulosus TaxID=76066 RepID=A0AAV7B0Z0_ENGPU|nr:hypothetical protein GDO81_013019 [Engystomops pustulosus]
MQRQPGVLQDGPSIQHKTNESTTQESCRCCASTDREEMWSYIFEDEGLQISTPWSGLWFQRRSLGPAARNDFNHLNSRHPFV